MMPEFTVKEYAAKEWVDERTVRRWIEKGAVNIRRTPGGGVRITETEARVAMFGMAKADTKRHPSR